MDDQSSNGVQEAEIVEDTAPAQDSSQATVLLSLEELIKNHIASIDKNAEEIKKMQQMYTDSFENDPVYRENEAKAKEAAKVRNTTRENIAKQPAVADLANKIKNLRMELKESKTSLSDYLLEYQRMTNGVNEIEGHDGEVREIINSARVIKKAAKK
jgi:hypothetical protein